MIDKDIVELLNSEAQRINNVNFIDADPVQFPRRFEKLQDIEITALLASGIAWGNRTMICRNCNRMLDLMDNQPFNYVMDQGYEDLNPDMNLHRTFFGRHFQHLLRGLHRIYKDYGSIDAFAANLKVGDEEAPSWKLVEHLNRILKEENNGETCSQALPLNLQNTALKRVNMALRWLVRDDGIVDMGVWKSIPKSKLFIPLDVHVGNTARNLGLIERKANDRKTTELLTDQMRILRPEDPAFYDYALFGIGINNK